MITEHDMVTIKMEVEAYIEKLMEEYMRAYLGDRVDMGEFGGEGYGEDIYGQEGRGPVEGGPPVGNIPQPITEL